MDSSEVLYYLNGIPFAVRIDGYSKGINASGPWRKCKFLCDWNDSDELMDALKGVGQYAGVGSTYVAVKPYRYPHNTNIMVLECSAIPIGPIRPDPKLLGAEFAEIDVSFGVPEFSADGTPHQDFTNNVAVPWSKVDIEVGIEEYQAKDLTLHTSGDTVTGKLTLPVQTITYRRGNIPYLAEYEGIVKGLVGRLNSAPFFGNPPFAIGTLRLESYSSHEGDRDPSGFILYDFDMVFRYREIDWNYELIPGTSRTWDYAEDGSSNKRYIYADFTPIVTYGL